MPSNYQLRCLDEQSWPLLNKFYKSHHASLRANKKTQAWVLTTNQQWLAALNLAPCSAGAFLGGVFVPPALRSQGLAKELIKRVHAQTEQTLWLFCAPELSHLYSDCGFSRCQDLPADLKERLQRYQRHKSLIAMHWQMT